MKIAAVAYAPWSLALTEPFAIAGGAQRVADNLLVRITLDDGSVGLGEAAPFPAANGETVADAERAIAAVARALVGQDARDWRAISAWLVAAGSASARCALETALLDALLRSCRLPMWAWFGGAGRRLETDYTITVGSSASAARAALRIAALGFHTIKLKVAGAALADDEERIARVVAKAPACALILDGNQGCENAEHALALVAAARAHGGNVVLLEQPLAKDDEREQARLVEKSDVPIAADESAGSLEDVRRIAERRLAQVVNLKIMKSGLVASADMAVAARALGLGLMIGAMVESPLALSASACLACGLGGFHFVDLDTHMFMRDLPTRGGFVQRGAVLDVSAIAAGHGVTVPASRPAAKPRRASARRRAARRP